MDVCIFHWENLWQFGMGIHNYQKTQAINRACKIRMYPGPWLFWVCPVRVHNTRWIFLCCHARDTTLDFIFEVWVHIGPVHFTASYGFNSDDTSFPKFRGNLNTIRKRQALIDDGQRIWRSPVRSGGHECLRNLRIFWVTPSFSFNLHSCHRNCSDTICEGALKIILNADGSDDDD